MMFKEILLDFLNDMYSEKKFLDHLKSFQPRIWKIGLVEEEVHLCVQIFVEYQGLSSDVQNELLYCIVPRQKIVANTLNALLAWFFSYKTKKVACAKHFISWLNVMLSNNLIESGPLEKIFNQLLLCFDSTELVSPLCHVLKHVVKPETVTERAIFIASSFYHHSIKYPGKNIIASLLRLFSACSPHLLPYPPKGVDLLQSSSNEFERAVSLLAFDLGCTTAVPDSLLNISLNSLYSTHQLDKNKDFDMRQINESFWKKLNEIPFIGRLQYLGRLILEDNIPPIKCAASVIGSKEGQLYLCCQYIFGKEFPPEDKYTVLPVLRKILETSRRMKDGLPALPCILSRYFFHWDGEENEEVIYNLITFANFESFNDLYSTLLCHLLNIFWTGTLRDKLNIINCLTTLIGNKINLVHRIDTIQIIIFVCKIIQVALISDALQTSALLLSALKFYHQISMLECKYKLVTWTVPPPFLVFGSLFSENHVVVNEVCKLIVRHNTIMYPHFISVGLINSFHDEEEIIKTYLRDFYLFLWKGQASVTELVSDDEESYLWCTPKEIDALLTVRSHFAIQSLISYVVSENQLDTAKKINDNSLERVLNKHCPGLIAVKMAYEESIPK